MSGPRILGVSAVLLLAMLSLVVTPAGAQPQKPNIILILSDDFGCEDSGPYGGGPGRGRPTPSLDRLADGGMTFFSFYAQPSCTPGRAAVQTGRIRADPGAAAPATIVCGDGTRQATLNG